MGPSDSSPTVYYMWSIVTMRLSWPLWSYDVSKIMGLRPWLLGSRDVIGHVTIRLAVGLFLWVVHCDHASIVHRYGDIAPQRWTHGRMDRRSGDFTLCPMLCITLNRQLVKLAHSLSPSRLSLSWFDARDRDSKTRWRRNRKLQVRLHGQMAKKLQYCTVGLLIVTLSP